MIDNNKEEVMAVKEILKSLEDMTCYCSEDTCKNCLQSCQWKLGYHMFKQNVERLQDAMIRIFDQIDIPVMYRPTLFFIRKLLSINTS